MVATLVSGELREAEHEDHLRTGLPHRRQLLGLPGGNAREAACGCLGVQHSSFSLVAKKGACV